MTIESDTTNFFQHFSVKTLQEKLLKLKKSKNAIILSHYYQHADIQDVADFTGDSLYLSQKAAENDADIILFAGVRFMAETAKILAPAKKVLLPDLQAGCSLADACPPERFKKFIDEHLHHYVVSYINCSAEVKAMSDIICTSSNAERIIRSVPENQPIIFAPDKNLGQHLIYKTGRNMLLWDGVCEIHEVFSMEKIFILKEENPDAQIIAHPECTNPMRKMADFIGSTGQIINYISQDKGNTYIILTEPGIIHQLEKIAPEKNLIPGPPYFDTSCACSECRFMKMNTLEKTLSALELETPEISLSKDLQQQAYMPLQKMLKSS